MNLIGCGNSLPLCVDFCNGMPCIEGSCNWSFLTKAWLCSADGRACSGGSVPPWYDLMAAAWNLGSCVGKDLKLTRGSHNNAWPARNLRETSVSSGVNELRRLPCDPNRGMSSPGHFIIRERAWWSECSEGWVGLSGFRKEGLCRLCDWRVAGFAPWGIPGLEAKSFWKFPWDVGRAGLFSTSEIERTPTALRTALGLGAPQFVQSFLRTWLIL